MTSTVCCLCLHGGIAHEQFKKVVVTGAAGFIGSWFSRELIENGYDLTVVVRNREKLLPDILDHSIVVEKSLAELGGADFRGPYDLFFNLAWAGVAAGQKNSLDMQLGNIRGALNALEVISRCGCKMFLSTGTVAEYALCNNVMDMTARQTPNDYYGAAKVSAHYFLEVRARQLKQPFIWSVIPSTFGEGRTDGNIVTYTIKSLLNQEKPVFGDLQQLWDFLYVKDVARALRLIGEMGKEGKVYGIGSGEYRTLKEYISCIRDVIDPSLPLGIGENRIQNKRTFSSCVNNYDLIKDTGFKPEYSFKKGIERTVQYYRDTYRK